MAELLLAGMTTAQDVDDRVSEELLAGTSDFQLEQDALQALFGTEAAVYRAVVDQAHAAMATMKDPATWAAISTLAERLWNTMSLEGPELQTLLPLPRPPHGRRAAKAMKASG